MGVSRDNLRPLQAALATLPHLILEPRLSRRAFGLVPSLQHALPALKLEHSNSILLRQEQSSQAGSGAVATA
eukprot:359182-Chlamydomonas_euryale.AAC.4